MSAKLTCQEQRNEKFNPGETQVETTKSAGTVADGYFSDVFVTVRPVYSLANLPRVALLPASLAVFGAISEDTAPRGREAGASSWSGRRPAPAATSRRCRRPGRRARSCRGRLDHRRGLVVVVLGDGDRSHPDEDDDHESGVPVDRHLPTIGGTTARCGDTGDRFPRGASRHGGTQPYSLAGSPSGGRRPCSRAR